MILGLETTDDGLKKIMKLTYSKNIVFYSNSEALQTVSTRETATKYILKLAKLLNERKVSIQFATANKVKIL